MPNALDELHGPVTGNVCLPASLFWSGSRPRDVRWDLSDRDLYEKIVLTEGTLDDIRSLIYGDALVELWDQMQLPPWVRDA